MAEDTKIEGSGLIGADASLLIGRYFPKLFNYTRPDGEKVDEPYGKITEHIGSGAFADVYRLELHPYHPLAKRLGHHVAVKLVGRSHLSEMSKSTEAQGRLISRFIREAKLGRLLSEKGGHPCLLKYSESDKIEFDLPNKKESYMYLILEYIPGAQSLFDYVKPDLDKRLSIEDAFSVCGRIADALQYMHDLDVTHRDIKPENILFSWVCNKKDETITGHLEKLIDLGIGKLSGEQGEKLTNLSVIGEVKGTPHYMSPEAADGVIGYDKEKDVWGLCATFYALIAGHPPFPMEVDDTQVDALFSKIRDGKELVPLLRTLRKDIPWEISDICAEGLIKDKKLRINTMELNREFKRISKKLGIAI